MGKNAQFRQNIKAQKSRAKKREEEIALKKQQREAVYRMNHPLVSHKYPENKKKELREFEQKLLKDSQLEI